jgi:HD-like signal output (HDOD) protein
MRPALVAACTPSLGELIAEHWKLPTGELCTVIAKHHPAATSAEIIAELRQADELERNRPKRAG